jgi:hypothetical protein
MRRILFAILLWWGALCANPHTLADIAGSSSAVAISTDTLARAAWVQLIAPSGNANNVRFGDSTTSSSKGGILVPGSGMLIQCPNACGLAGIYVYVVTGDTLNVTWGD